MQEILFRHEKFLLDARNENFSPSHHPILMSNTLQLPYRKSGGSIKRVSYDANKFWLFHMSYFAQEISRQPLPLLLMLDIV